MIAREIRFPMHRALWGMAAAALMAGAGRTRSLTRVAAGLGAAACWHQALRARDGQGDLQVEHRATVHRPRLDVYRAWRRLEDLPRYFPHLASVQEGAGNRSHWVATGPAGLSLAWDAELTEEWEGEQLTWRSLLGSDLQTEGIFRLRDAPDGRGTEVKLCLSYRSITPAFAPLLQRVTKVEVREGLRRFKQFLEAGEIPTTAGQSSGRAKASDTLPGASALLPAEAHGNRRMG